MFEAKLSDGSILRKIIEAIKDIVNEANFECTSTGIYAQAMDTSHVSLVSLELSSEMFCEYRCDRNIVIGINIPDMLKVLRCANVTDSVAMKCQDDGDILTFTLSSKEGDKVSTFSSKLMNIDTESLVIPKLESETVVTLPSQRFADIVKDISQFSESMVISTSKGMVNFIAKDNVTHGEICLISNDEIPSESVKIEHTACVKQKFSVRFLNLFAKSHGLSSNVRLLLQNELPVCVEYNIEPNSSLKFYLAPGFNDDENEDDSKK